MYCYFIMVYSVLHLYLFFIQKESILQSAAAFHIKPNYMGKIKSVILWSVGLSRQLVGDK